MEKKLETLIFTTILLVCFVLEIGDIFNLFDFVPAKYISVTTLFLVALTLRTVGSVRHECAERHQEGPESHQECPEEQQRCVEAREHLRLSHQTHETTAVQRVHVQIDLVPVARNSEVQEIKEETAGKDA